MGILNIREAQRKGARLLIGLAGVSGGGKTYSALRLAYGLANGDAKKIGLLDTENRRGSLYADKLPGGAPFLIADLLPPFSPQRYIEAVKEFEKAGVEVLIIDSVTHAHEGEGGCQEIADKNKLGGLPNWALAKGLHKRFVNTLLYCDMHVIVCLRAREKSRPQEIIENGKKKTVYVNEGLQAITEKNFLFEMTASLMVTDQGKSQDVIKCPDDLMPFLGRGKGYLTEDDGRGIRAWVDGAPPLNPSVEKYRARFVDITEQGMKAVIDGISQTPQKIIDALGEGFFEEIKASAAEYDRQRLESTPDPANDNQRGAE